MINKCGVFVTRTLKQFCVRNAHSVASDQSSYLKNPGSEPLIISTFGNRVAKAAQKHPGRVAIKSIHEDVTITYEELLNYADSFGCALRERSFSKGDKLGIWSHNCTQWVVAVLGAMRAGVIPVLLNPVYEKPELSYCINKTKLRGIFTGNAIKTRNYNKMLCELIPEINSFKDGAISSNEFPTLRSVISAEKEKINGIFSMDSLIRDHKNNSSISKYSSEIKPEDGSLVLLTSGSTGKPKAALDSELAIVNNTYFSGIRNEFNLGHQIVCIQAPLFHALGSIVTLLSCLQHGATVILASPAYSPSASLRAICAEKCTAITGTPTMYVDILSIMKGKGDLPINLNMALAAGAPCGPELIHRIKAQLKCKSVRALYGLTETAACVFQSLATDDVNTVSQTVGYITDHVELKVVDSNSNIVPFGCSGELMVKGYNNMICYLDDPEKTKEIMTEDGWLHTGDIFIINPDGYGKIIGRAKDIIVRGGENIAPKEIEDCLNTHPDVIESQVIGVSDERLGEELCAVVRIRENATFTSNDLKKHFMGKLATFKIPKILKITQEFPKTTSGKIQKYRLKELVESGKI
ncbi:medium-chain acyl-CoA ligase ACSF2, mitochondrial-like isoform X1 [Danaus plexippus]|uniref:medium-chain acyl-CoA ligase ACSF2, mitochondrial-like isoform X1 n=1 Tax=Danaus plexippus TaxID=13037 RepID=UPI002AB16CF3|nr:medium-chain acyl-CoA ligase ACSF2, mitochondrial-like isoform X1 [Danaus plexippus]